MLEPHQTLPNDPAALQAIITSLHEEHDHRLADLRTQHEREIAILHEQIAHLRQLLFGRSSERLPADATTVQLPLFDLPEPEHIVRIPRHPASDSTRRRPRIPRDSGRLFQ